MRRAVRRTLSLPPSVITYDPSLVDPVGFPPNATFSLAVLERHELRGIAKWKLALRIAVGVLGFIAVILLLFGGKYCKIL